MIVKYDLEKMLKEIQEDEQLAEPTTQSVYQNQIHEMMLKNLKKRKGKQG